MSSFYHLKKHRCPRQESNPHLSLRTGLLYPLSYGGKLEPCQLITGAPGEELYGEQFAQLGLVESDDEVLSDGNHGYAHLSAFFYHLLALREVGADVVIGECDAICCEEILRRVAEVTGRCRV